MEPKKISVSGLFETNVQYRIPLFQRYYVWDRDDQWEPLWHDISQRNLPQTEKTSNHFTGAIVIQQQKTLAGNVPKYDIIDGQQRLTTFQIILCAIRDICKSNGHTDIANEVSRYIRNQGELLKENEQYKLIPTKRDRKSFISLVDGYKSRGKIFSAYSYFTDRIANYADGDKEKTYTLFLSIRH